MCSYNVAYLLVLMFVFLRIYMFNIQCTLYIIYRVHLHVLYSISIVSFNNYVHMHMQVRMGPCPQVQCLSQDLMTTQAQVFLLDYTCM